MSIKKVIGYTGLILVFLFVVGVQAYEYGLIAAILNWVIVAFIFAIIIYCIKLIEES